jgi:hypothetical protein
MQHVVLEAPGPGAPPPKAKSNLRLIAAAVGAVVVIALALVALWDRTPDASGQGLVYTIPYGASEGIVAGIDSAITLPTRIIFEPGDGEPVVTEEDGAIVVRGGAAAITVINNDGVTERAGPFLVGPGQTFIQRFPTPGDYPITCTVDDAESILVTVR